MKGKRQLKDEIIGRRRFELFIRDPLKKDMETVFRGVFAPNITKDERYKRHDLFEYLWKKINRKWNCYLLRNWDDENLINFASGEGTFVDYISWDEMKDPAAIIKSNACYLFSSGASTVLDYGRKIEKLRKKLKTRIENPFSREGKEFKSKGWIFEYLTGGYDDRGQVYIPVSPERIILGIDIGGLTEKTGKARIAEEVWKIIKPKIKEIKTKDKRHIPAFKDSPEIGFITAITDDEFAKYLKWYDLHTEKGYTFRKIALYESWEKNHPDIAEEAKIRLENKTKKIKTNKGKERIIKGFIGESIKGEDNVEKAVKLIYQAIHRKKYPPKKKLKSFNCPEHGNKCPQGCSYLEKYMEDFNKRNMLFKPLYTTDPSNLNNIQSD